MDPSYELVSLLGTGGMGRVYDAIHRPTGRRVVVKVPGSRMRADARVRRALLDEATAAARLEHPNIVKLVDVGRDERGAPFLVMERIDGHDLTRWVAHWPGWGAVRAALLDVLDALAAAHGAGIVHGDVKPANLLRANDGTVKLADFGVARVMEPLREPDPETVLAGTPYYMAPEQLGGPGAIGPWTDLFAVGITLYELLSGRSPFPKAHDPMELRRGRLLSPPAPLVPRDGLAIDVALQVLVSELMRVHPRFRPRFAAEVRARLKELTFACREGRLTDSAPRSMPTEPAATVGPPVPSTASEAIAADAPIGNASTATWGGPTTLVEGRRKGASSSGALDLPASLPAAPGAGSRTALGELRIPRLVGRRTETDALEQAIDDVDARRTTRLVLLLGDAGVGKSRLASWGYERVETDGRMERCAAGFDVSGAETASGLRASLRRLLGAPDRDGSGAHAWAWLQEESGLPFDEASMARYLGGAALPIAEEVALARAGIRAVARRLPVYLWLDDLGYARDGTLDLVERLLDDGDAAVLVIATVRTGTADHPRVAERLARLRGRAETSVVTVGKLGAEGRQALLDSLLPLRPGLAAELARAVDETPLVLVQLVRQWLDDGVLARREDGFAPRRGLTAGDLARPDTIARVFARRIETLVSAFGDRAGDAEAVLARAALLGHRFEEAALRAASLEPETAEGGLLDAVLDRALLDGLLRARAGGYRFEHALLQEALLGRLAGREDRPALLTGVARALLDVYGRHRADLATRAASLYREAGNGIAAVRVLRDGVIFLARGGDLVGAGEVLDAAARIVQEDGAVGDDARRVAYLYALAHHAYYACRYEEADAIIDALLPILEGAGDAYTATRLRFLRCSTLFYRNRYAECEELLEQIDRTGTLHGEDEEEHLGVFVTHRRGELAELRGDNAAGVAKMRESLALAERFAPEHRVRLSRFVLAEALAAAGEHAEARALSEALLADARQKRDLIAWNIELLLAWLDVLGGEPSRARQQLLERARDRRGEGEPWDRTRHLAVEAAVSADLDGNAELADVVDRFTAAFEAVPVDAPLTRLAMARLRDRLRARRLGDRAERVDALLAERAAAIAAGFRRR